MTKHDFILCGIAGWCMEILWTGFHSLLAGQATMMGRTSLLMFPIYGCAAVIGHVYPRIAPYPVILRCLLYAAGFFAVEFASGMLLNLFGICPWNYTGTPFALCGVIRLDYAPLWALTGLFFEKLLVRRKAPSFSGAS